MQLAEPGKRFQLTLSGYEFPAIVDQKHDSNWLNITVDIQVPEGSYQVTRPCLLTWEVGWIALWLQNVACHIPQSSVVYAMEPNLAFEHLRTESEQIVLRVLLGQEMRPPWVDRRDQAAVDFTVPRWQVADAAVSLRAQLQQFPPRAGVETQPPFVRPDVSSSFFIDWLLEVPGKSEDEAFANARRYMELSRLEPVRLNSHPHSRRPGQWYVRCLTDLWTPERDPFRALFQLLSSIYGSPRVYSPHLRPDGVFSCRGELEPRPPDGNLPTPDDDLLAYPRAHFTLTNLQSDRRYWWLLKLCSTTNQP